MNWKKILVLSLLVVGVAVLSGCTEIAEKCSSDTDCVPAQCCHPTGCVPEDLAPDCSAVSCTMECKPGTMDCGQGRCVCENGECKVEWGKVEEKYYCESDSDCVHLPSPCHQGSQECVSKDYASGVSFPSVEVACTKECRPCTECYCEDNVCKTRTLEPPGCC